MNVGDLVTGADAPEGAPSWLGVVKSITTIHWVKRLGREQPEPMAKWAFRPITDSEAVGLAEALTWERWRPFGTAGVLALFPDGGVIALAALRGEWSFTAPIGGGRIGSIAQGKAALQEDGKVAASRALLRWMCSP